MEPRNAIDRLKRSGHIKRGGGNVIIGLGENKNGAITDGMLIYHIVYSRVTLLGRKTAPSGGVLAAHGGLQDYQSDDRTLDSGIFLF